MREQHLQPLKTATDQSSALDMENLDLQIEQSGGLSTEQIDTIKNWTWDYFKEAGDELYLRLGIPRNAYVYFELVVIDLLLHPATFYDTWSNLEPGEKQAMILSLEQKARDLRNCLEKVSIKFAKLFEQTPEFIDSNLLHWQGFIHRLLGQVAMFGYDLIKNPFFPILQTWLDGQAQTYSPERVSNMRHVVSHARSSQRIAEDKAALTDFFRIPGDQSAQQPDENDYEVLFLNHLRKATLTDCPEHRQFIAPLLISEIDRLVGLHKGSLSYDKIDTQLLLRADNYKKWLAEFIKTDRETTASFSEPGNRITSGKSGEMKNEQVLDFSMLFNKISDYARIKEILGEQGYIDPNTLIWKDYGNGYKSVLICILKVLKTKGYFKNDIKLTNKLYQGIAKQTFHVQVSIDCVKQTKDSYTHTDFIPYASTQL